MELRRHDFLEITEIGRVFAFQSLKTLSFEKKKLEAIEKMLTAKVNGHFIPAIVRRKERHSNSGLVAVGFSSPFRVNGNRFRIPAFVPMDEIQKTVTPYDVIQKSYQATSHSLTALKEVRTIALRNNIKIGVLGSAALEIMTTLPYTDNHSDLDLVMKCTDIDLMKKIYFSIKNLEQPFECQIDLEIEINGIGFKAAELFQDTKQILGKSIDNVQLYSRTNVMEWIDANTINEGDVINGSKITYARENFRI